MPRRWLLFALLGAIGLLIYQQRQTIGTFITTMTNTLSDAGAALIKQLESYSPTPYPDAGGYSVFWGHFLGNTKEVTKTAEEYFADDVARAQHLVNQYISAPLNQNQFDALVSFAYNLGSHAFRNDDGSLTHVTQYLNAGDYANAAASMSKFVNSQGKVVPALVARREAEIQLFLS